MSNIMKTTLIVGVLLGGVCSTVAAKPNAPGDRAVVVAATTPPEASASRQTKRSAVRSQDMALEELEKLTAEYAARPGAYKETCRPQFHFTPLTGWMNDPNGLVYYAGEYHLYFQAWPQNVAGGGKIWSHAVSTDLVHWRQIEHSLVNEGARQIFSGSAVIDHNNTAGFQTGKEKTLVAAYTLTSPNVQCIAYSNDRGRTFTKVKKPVVDTIMEKDRDPKVFWHEPSQKWVMILYLGAREKFILFGSRNLKDWTKLSDLPFPDGHECPELFELPIDGNKNNTRWIVWEASGKHMIGRFDGETFAPETNEPLPSEWGENCYAGQTWNDVPDGRRIFIGWMHAKVGKHVEQEIYPDMPFTQQMSVPRTLSLRTTPQGLRLYAEPVKELEALREAEKQWKDLELKPGSNPLPVLSGELFDVELELETGSAKTITFDVRGTPITYDAATRMLSCLGSTVGIETPGRTLKLRVLIDRTSIEIFVNDGRYVMSYCFRAEGDKLSLTAQGGTARIQSLKVWPLKSIWPDSPKR